MNSKINMSKLLTITLTIVIFTSLTPDSSHAENKNVQNGSSIEELKDMSLEELMKIKVVTATKTEISIIEVPATMRVITDRDIRDRRYRYLQELLYDQPGFDISFMQGLYGSIFRQRGLDQSENSRTLVFIDGILDNNISSGSAYIKHKYSLHNIKRVEILYGPASALYGANAFSGIINLITKDGKDIKNFLEYGLGGIAYDSSFKRLAPYANFTVGHQFGDSADDFSFIISGHWINTEGPILERYDNKDPAQSNYWWSDKYSASSLDNNYMVNFKASWRDMTFGFVQSRDYNGQGTYATGAAYTENGDLAFWNTLSTTVYGKYKFRINKMFTNTTQIVYRETRSEGTDGDFDTKGDTTGEIDITWYTRPDKEILFENPFMIKWNKNMNTIAGIAVRIQQAWNYNKSSQTYSSVQEALDMGLPDKPSVDGDNKYYYNNYAMYLQHYWRFLKKMSLTLGYRFDIFQIKGEKGWEFKGSNENVLSPDYIDDATALAAGYEHPAANDWQWYWAPSVNKTYTTHNPRIGYVFLPKKNLSIKFLYGEAFRAPTVREFFSTSSSRITNPNLKPEKIRTIELGTTYLPFNYIKTEFVGFANFINDMINQASTTYYKDYSTSTYLTQFQNSGKARVLGFDITLRANPIKWITVYGTYTFQDARLTSVPNESLKSHDPDDGTPSNIMPRVAKHKGNIGLNMLVKKHINIDIKTNIVGERPNIYTNPYNSTDAYIIVNGNIGTKDWPLTGMDITFKVYNMFDSNILDPGYRSADGAYYPSALPLPRRYFEFELSHKLQ